MFTLADWYAYRDARYALTQVRMHINRNLSLYLSLSLSLSLSSQSQIGDSSDAYD